MRHTHSMRALRELRQAIQKHLTVHGARGGVARDTREPAGAHRAAVASVRGPNRFGLPAFYMLHVWAWQDSPTRTFMNWHANVPCDAFRGQPP
jgi:hypothetical protein